MEFFIVQFRFSIHEMAVFDLPAALKKVISISGGKSVAYAYTILHLAQIMTYNCFKAFDWKDRGENQRIYNSDEPPTYELSSISVPVVLFWSDNDCLSTARDVTKLERELSTIISTKQVDFLHLDYLWGENACSGLYRDIARLLENRTKEL